MIYNHLVTDNNHWRVFFKTLFRAGIWDALDIDLSHLNIPVIKNEFLKFHGTAIVDSTIHGRFYIKGVIFDSEEDLLYFKLKFS